MRSTRRLWWGDYRTSELNDLDAERVVAVLPVAAIEQHGSHLPVSTDTTIMHGMLETVIPLVPADLDLRILPVQAVGKSNEHIRFPGTLTLDAVTLIGAWTQLGASLARAGVRKLVIVNSHGGNEEIMGIVARELRVAHDMVVVKTSWGRFGRPEGLYSDIEERYGIHGGDVETSLLLHFRPDLVDMSAAADFRSRTQDRDDLRSDLRPQGTHAYAWLSGDLNPAGTVGEAAKATADKGRLTAEHQARGFVALCAELANSRLSDLIA